MEVGEGDYCGRKDTRFTDVLETMDVPENGGSLLQTTNEDEQADEVFVLRQDFSAQISAGNAMQAAWASAWVTILGHYPWNTSNILGGIWKTWNCGI